MIQVADMYGNPATYNYDLWGIPGYYYNSRFGYTGQIWVPELGMWYYKARFYSPGLGRFVQTDPVGYKDQMNLYAYVGNDPVKISVRPVQPVSITGIPKLISATRIEIMANPKSRR